MNNRPARSGFTIVELLIVIVVVGILATITITAFNGIQKRAMISDVTADMRNLKTRMDIFNTDNGRYPLVYNGVFPMNEAKQLLKDAKLYDSTRTAATAKKYFMFCSTTLTGDDLTIVAVHISGNLSSTGLPVPGETFFYASSNATGTKTYSGGGANANICADVIGPAWTDSPNKTARWSYDIPTQGSTAP